MGFDSILVLGATGFVGTNTCNALEEKGIPHFKSSLSLGVDLCDLQETISLIKYVKPNMILNFSAKLGSLNYVTEQAADVIYNNAQMTLSLYEAVKTVNPNAIIINPIGSCTYPGNLEIYNEDNWCNGEVHKSVLSYGSARRFTHAVSECYKIQYGIKTINLLVNNMYGPNESNDPNKAHALSALVSKFVKARNEKQPFVTVWGTGKPIREWLYINDFAKIIIEILKEPKKYIDLAPFNIAQKYGKSIRELVGIIIKETNYEGQVVYDTKKQDGALVKVMDNGNFSRIFPDFNFTSLEEGIRATKIFYDSIYPY